MNTARAELIAHVGAANVLIGILWVGLDRGHVTEFGEWLGIAVLSFGILLLAIGMSQSDADTVEADDEADDEYRFDGGDD